MEFLSSYSSTDEVNKNNNIEIKTFKKDLKKTITEIKRIRKLIYVLEKKSCYSDKDLEKKEKELNMLNEKIRGLKLEKDRLWRKLSLVEISNL